jgi:thiol-disulfide isomerase/thioredoxin
MAGRLLLALAAALAAVPAVAGPLPVDRVDLVPASAAEVQDAVRSSGARVSVVNVWATWCLPCREEFPDLIRFGRDFRDRGVALVLVSGDFADDTAPAREFLAEHGVDFRTYLKAGKDQEFIDAFDSEWSGALPATFVYDAAGVRRRSLLTAVSYETLVREVSPLLVAVPSTTLALAIGDAMPSAEVKMKAVDGREITLADSVGAKGTLVVFSCNHCPFVKAWEARLAALGNDYAGKGFGVVAINSNDPGTVPQDGFEEMRARAEERGFEFPYAVDGRSDIARAFGASRTPEVFLFDASGKLAYHGAIDDNSQDAGAVEAHFLRDALEALLAGRTPDPAETKALGCSIKFR